MATPLFILSFRHRDEVSAVAEAAGWQPLAARRGAGVEARFLASGAAVALIDARGAAEEGLAAVRALGDAVEANAGALLVLLSKGDEALLGQMHALGATHFLVSPFSEPQLCHAIRFAERHADRVGGDRPLARRAPAEGESGESWRWRQGERSVSLSAALARKAGLSEGELTARMRQLLRLIGNEGREAARAAVRRLVATGEPTAFAHADPEQTGARVAHHLRLGDDGSVIGRSEMIGGADHWAEEGRDLLTGVGDARSARSWLGRRLAAPAAPDEPAAVLLLLALTRFDAINSAFGRASGDAVLQSAARRIQRLVDADGEQRCVARLAGAEFAILLSAPGGAAEGRFLAGQLVQAMGRPFLSGDHVITIGSRVGIAVSRPGDSAAALLRRASTALADAKAPDGAPVSLIDADAEQASAKGDRLEIDLRRALHADEIEILFQPQVDIASGRIVGAEALARWSHPHHGVLGAHTLFSVAERSEYLAQLSDHVQRKAIRIAAGWAPGLRELRIAVNITAQDIVRPGFAADLLRQIGDSGLDPRRVTAEVTESGLIEDLPAAATLLTQLRGGGLRIAIDDFGTGYSSLAYLKALPIDYLKLDKRLSEDISGSARDRVVVSSVIDMARSLGLAVIAEGVETNEQLHLLAQEGCALYQGFLCAPPLTSSALAELVAGQPPSEAAA